MTFGATGDFGYMGWGMGFGGLMMVFWAVLLIALVVFLVKATTGTTTTTTSRPDAGEILEQRYARGEINTTDYEERKQILHSAH